ncbi:uncharacterized protein SPAPADRAFT_59548 [Spathaspora passalidarum NRRL Y-27907]|uniref:Uncharacterized protein n=1 Tax=Spathaspora passalidarum (strain NRRL Y-27907 / 11-Y1) TaxID=619300 RepID=G3AHG6_SPAPN|nr:uncharacterized protein SPAPADRAFT_59548 [Spathaspora passalidarum NRRL Y-27907]EGW34130.1 hypothetical protein SPAPADRAFT_59548 [Spathaspora passalidarum NRRL Y-27907]
MEPRVYLMYLMNCEPPSEITNHHFHFVKVENDEQLLYDLIHRAEIEYAPEYIIKYQDHYTWNSKYDINKTSTGDLSDITMDLYELESNINWNCSSYGYAFKLTLIPFFVPHDSNFIFPPGVDPSWFEIVPVHNDTHLIKHLLTTVRGDQQNYLQLTRTGKLIYRDLKKSFADCQVFPCDSRSINRAIDTMVENMISSFRWPGPDYSNYERCRIEPLAKRIFEGMDQEQLRGYMEFPVWRDQKLIIVLFVSDYWLFRKLKKERNITIDEMFQICFSWHDYYYRCHHNHIEIMWHYKNNYTLVFENGKLELQTGFYEERDHNFELKCDFTSENMKLIKNKIESRHREALASLPSNVFVDSENELIKSCMNCGQ